jgi:hypothetical protein
MGLHHLWHKFTRRFKDRKTQKYKLSGYALIRAIERWVDRNAFARNVQQCRIDDSYHAGSDVFLIPHEHDGEYWGTTVLVVTQCDGQPPCEFFLYDHHAKGLYSALDKILKKHRSGKASR